MAPSAVPGGGKTRDCEHGMVQSEGPVGWSVESFGASATREEKEGMHKVLDSATGELEHLAPESLLRSVEQTISDNEL